MRGPSGSCCLQEFKSDGNLRFRRLKNCHGVIQVLVRFICGLAVGAAGKWAACAVFCLPKQSGFNGWPTAAIARLAAPSPLRRRMSKNTTTTDPIRSDIMRAVKSAETTPVMIVRRLVHAMGYRYRLHRRDLPGKPDLVFGPRHNAIFANDCFWHGHDCVRGAREPKANAQYWRPQIARNVERDATNEIALKAAGSSGLTDWEYQTKTRDRAELELRLREFLD